MKAGVLRTPDECFDSIADFPFAPTYVEIDGYRIHYVDGEPSWCYLYRNVIGPLVESGHRCVAPDLAGFGRSDKHVHVMSGFVRALDQKLLQPRASIEEARVIDWLKTT